MINTASLDTSAIVRVVADHGSPARMKVLKLLDQNLIFKISDVAISETVYVLETVYRKSREEIGDLLLLFLGRYDEKIQYNYEMTAAVFPFYLAHPKLSFNDCLLASLAELENAEPLFTLDKKLAKQHPSAKLI